MNCLSGVKIGLYRQELEMREMELRRHRIVRLGVFISMRMMEGYLRAK